MCSKRAEVQKIRLQKRVRGERDSVSGTVGALSRARFVVKMLLIRILEAQNELRNGRRDLSRPLRHRTENVTGAMKHATRAR